MENNQKAHLIKLLEKKAANFNFSHPIQRGEGQWNAEQKSKLIDSILREYVIDPARVVVSMVDEAGEIIKDENGKDVEFNVVMDGKQRMTNIIAFLNDGFKLSKHIQGEPPVIINGEVYNMDDYVGLVFSELPEALQDKIVDSPFNVNYLRGVSDWDLREMFKRQNGGKTLTKAQMNAAKISPTLYNEVCSILQADGCLVSYERTNKKGEVVSKEKEVENFWRRSLGAGVFKNGEDRNLVLATMMFVCKYNNLDFGLLNTDIEGFISWFDEQDEAFRADIVNQVITAADKLNSKLGVEGKVKNLKKTSIPHFVAGMAKVIREKGGTQAYLDNVEAFFADYENQTEFKQLVFSGSANKESVQQRWEIFVGFTK